MWPLQELIDLLGHPLTPIVSSTVVGLFIIICYIKRDYIHIVSKTIVRDVIGTQVLLRVKLSNFRQKRQNATVASLFKANVLKHPDKVLFYYEDERWTFKDVDVFSNKVANCFSSLGYAAGDEVSLFMEARPEYIGIWLGLSKIGVIPALVNTGLRTQSLASSIGVVTNTKAVIFGSELTDEVKEAELLLTEKNIRLEYFSYGDIKSKESLGFDLKRLVENSRDSDPDYRGSYTDHLLYIYTSGTTGLPKAAIIKQSRYMVLAAPNFMPGLIDTDSHIIYCPMPLYHSLGGGVGVGLGLIYGHSVVLRKKFSPSVFWQDCAKYKCTMFIYVGEVCRYLLSQPDRPSDREHCVRLMLGVGLRPSVWREFKSRFGVKSILEFYGSTEGNIQIVNITGKEGACGFLPQFIPNWIFNRMFPVLMIKVNPESGEVIRDANGLCTICTVGEIGQFVVRIVTGDPVRSFDGYIDREATKKKILTNVQKAGDQCFMTGDLVEMDKYGYIYFKDRIGDTFRWKSENVSTNEVESVLMEFVKTDAVVYGVEVAGCEGRAGMAAIQTLNANQLECEFKQLFKYLKSSLPSFAIPVFIRIVSQVEVTGTFKFNKVALKADAFNPTATSDAIYYLNSNTSSYEKLSQSLYEDICNGQIRF